MAVRVTRLMHVLVLCCLSVRLRAGASGPKMVRRWSPKRAPGATCTDDEPFRTTQRGVSDSATDIRVGFPHPTDDELTMVFVRCADEQRIW